MSRGHLCSRDVPLQGMGNPQLPVPLGAWARNPPLPACALLFEAPGGACGRRRGGREGVYVHTSILNVQEDQLGGSRDTDGGAK